MNKEFLKKCWEDKRLHSLMVLIIWIIVLAVMMGAMFIANAIGRTDNNDTPSKTTETSETAPTILSYYDKLHNLVSSDYDFTYIINKNDEKIKFEGYKSSSGIEGYKQDKIGIIKFKIENQKVYQILIDQVIEITNLYEGIDASLLDLNYLIGILNQVSEDDVIVTEEETITTYGYNLTKDGEQLEIIVIENDEAIEEIKIHKNNEIYELMYIVNES